MTYYQNIPLMEVTELMELTHQTVVTETWICSPFNLSNTLNQSVTVLKQTQQTVSMLLYVIKSHI